MILMIVRTVISAVCSHIKIVYCLVQRHSGNYFQFQNGNSRRPWYALVKLARKLSSRSWWAHISVFCCYNWWTHGAEATRSFKLWLLLNLWMYVSQPVYLCSNFTVDINSSCVQLCSCVLVVIAILCFLLGGHQLWHNEVGRGKQARQLVNEEECGGKNCINSVT